MAIRFISDCPPGLKASMTDRSESFVILWTIKIKKAEIKHKIIKYPNVVNVDFSIILSEISSKESPIFTPSMT